MNFHNNFKSFICSCCSYDLPIGKEILTLQTECRARRLGELHDSFIHRTCFELSNLQMSHWNVSNDYGRSSLLERGSLSIIYSLISVGCLFSNDHGTQHHYVEDSYWNSYQVWTRFYMPVFIYRCPVKSSTNNSATSTGKQTWIKKGYILYASFCFQRYREHFPEGLCWSLSNSFAGKPGT